MVRSSFIAFLMIVAGFAAPAWAQSNLEVPQTQNQVPMPTFTPRAAALPRAQQMGEGSTLQIPAAPTATPLPQQVAPAPQYVDPTVAAAAAAAAAVNALLMAQPPPGASQPPAVPTPAPLAPSFTVQSAPTLPPVFRGCWQGEVAVLDRLQRMPGAHKVGYWTPKTYRLCYKRVGSGPFQLTFSQTGVVANEQIMNAHGHVDALATDGRAYAKMRSDLSFDEYHVDPALRGTTFTVDEVAMLDCRITGDAMAVTANVNGTRDGEPWFKAKWHADFRPVPE